MNRRDVKNAILSILDDMGIFILEKQDEDIDLTEYIANSIDFITFYLEIENKFAVEMPDEMLSIDYIKSINGLADKIVWLNMAQNYSKLNADGGENNESFG